MRRSLVQALEAHNIQMFPMGRQAEYVDGERVGFSDDKYIMVSCLDAKIRSSQWMTTQELWVVISELEVALASWEPESICPVP